MATVVVVVRDSGSDCVVEAGAVELASCSVWADCDEKVVRLGRRVLASVVGMLCRGVVLRTVGADERLSAAAESGDVSAVLCQFKTVQRMLQRKWTVPSTLQVTLYRPARENGALQLTSGLLCARPADLTYPV